MAVRRFTDVALMIRSDVGVTVAVLPPSSKLHAPVFEVVRLALTACFAPLGTEPDVFCFFVIGQPYANGHAGPSRTRSRYREASTPSRTSGSHSARVGKLITVSRPMSWRLTNGMMPT